jgi:competence ComEA-like helix-hairpin-helix protein
MRETARIRDYQGLGRGFVAGFFLTALALAATQEKAAGPPDAKGKETLEKICVGCHELDVVTATRRTKIGWQQNVDDMVSRGAEGSDQEIAEVVDYLTKVYGKLNVNTAPAQQLQEFLGFSEKEAQAVIAYRDRNGNIKDFEQLKAIPGLSPDKLQEKRSLIAFTL